MLVPAYRSSSYVYALSVTTVVFQSKRCRPDIDSFTALPDARDISLMELALLFTRDWKNKQP